MFIFEILHNKVFKKFCFFVVVDQTSLKKLDRKIDAFCNIYIYFFALALKARKVNINIKNLTLFFRYSAISLKRKFSPQQKKRNSSITEGYRDEFSVNLFCSCLNTFLSARGARSEDSARGLEPEVSVPPGWLTIAQASALSRQAPGVSSLDERGNKRLSCLVHPHGVAEGTGDRRFDSLGVCSSASEGIL